MGRLVGMGVVGGCIMMIIRYNRLSVCVRAKVVRVFSHPDVCRINFTAAARHNEQDVECE